MSRIHIARDRQPLGNFSPDEVAEGLKSGRFRPTDLAWQEPMETWKALGEFTNLPEVEEDDDELLAPPSVPAAGEPSTESGTQPAWERRAELGFLPALSQTVKQVLSAPTDTFSAMKTQGGFATPLRFFVVLSTLGWWTSFIYQIISMRIAPEVMMAKIAPQMRDTMLSGQIGLMVMTPFCVILSAFISAGILHVVLMGLTGSEKSFETTFRAYCYAAGAASIFLIVPLCGTYIYFIASVVLVIFAIQNAYRISGGMATLGVLLPTIMCCGLMAGGYLLMMAQMMAKGLIK